MRKAQKDTTYWLKGMQMVVRKGDFIPDDAIFEEERAEKAAPENRAEKAAPKNRAAKKPAQKKDA